jgi:hypothetical protein
VIGLRRDPGARRRTLVALLVAALLHLPMAPGFLALLAIDLSSRDPEPLDDASAVVPIELDLEDDGEDAPPEEVPKAPNPPTIAELPPPSAGVAPMPPPAEGLAGVLPPGAAVGVTGFEAAEAIDRPPKLMAVSVKV